MNDQFNLDDILNEYSAQTGGKQPDRRENRNEMNVRPEKRKNTPDINRGNDASKRTGKEGNFPVRTERATGSFGRIPAENRQQKHTERTPARQTKNRIRSKKNRGISPLLVLLFVLAAVVLAGGLFVTYSGLVYPNTCADDVNLGMLSSGKAYQKLQQSGWQERTENILSVRTYQNVTVTVDPVEAGVILSTEAAVSLALRYGRQSNIFSNLLSFVKALGTKTDINGQNTVLNTAYIRQQAELCQEKLNEALGELYYIDEENAQLVLVKGQGSMFLNTAELQNRITEALRTGQSEIEFRELLTDPVSPDMELIHSLVCTGAEDASFSTDGTHTVLEGKPGYEFSTTEAQTLWNAAAFGETVRIPLEISRSTVTAAYVESMMYHDLLGAVTTKFNNSGENRCSNVRLAASKIDGVVLFPGEEFSFNDTVGVRSAEAGFLSAPAYAGYNDIKEEIGGGVCQVSSGLYAAALFSFLDITKHTCHVYPPNYIQLGTDATVTIPESGGRSIDLRFVNSKNWPVKIVAYCEETEDRGDGKPLRTVTVEIWGTLEDDDYMPVEFDNSYIDIYDYDRVIEPAYPDREGYKLKFTHDEQAFEDDNGSGIRTATHRKVYDSKGNLVEDKIINPTYSAGYALDTYYFMQ